MNYTHILQKCKGFQQSFYYQFLPCSVRFRARLYAARPLDARKVHQVFWQGPKRGCSREKLAGTAAPATRCSFAASATPRTTQTHPRIPTGARARLRPKRRRNTQRRNSASTPPPHDARPPQRVYARNVKITSAFSRIPPTNVGGTNAIKSVPGACTSGIIQGTKNCARRARLFVKIRLKAWFQSRGCSKNGVFRQTQSCG